MYSERWNTFALAIVGTCVLCITANLGCQTSAPWSSDHPIVGTWEYDSRGRLCTREFAPNGVVTLMIDGAVQWSGAWHARNATDVVVVLKNGMELEHQLLKNGKLNVENKFVAARRFDP